MRRYICRTCHFQLQTTFLCVCCNRNIEQHLCKQYNVEDYDFSQYIVSSCLPDTSDEQDDKYICVSCHKRLLESNSENLCVPYFVNNRCVNAGAKFLKALQEKPQYVCTCCHRLLFHKTVVPFHLQEYDMTNDTVQNSLSYRYRMKLHKTLTSQQHCQYMQHEWPHISQNNPHDDDDDDAIYMEEYICIRCRQSLKQRNPKMPNQACANGLKLDDIPQDLQQLLTLERRLISFRLPFITIIVMRRYGGHFKVSGPPVNVPTTLDQVINMLPRMPNQLQLYPIKLKRKLEYKSHYMYQRQIQDFL